MSQNDVQNAITNALVQGGSQWLVSTIVAFLPVLWTLTLMLHLGRPYIVRTLRRCGLRLGADIWWMSYLLIRDGVLMITFALSWLFFAPNIVVNAALPLTGPLATLCLLLALAIKLTRRADDDVNAYRWTTAFLVLGATLYYGPQVFAVEATSQSYLAGFGQIFTSNTDTTAALVLMWIALVGALLVVGWLFVQAFRSASRTMARKLSAQPRPAPVKQTSPAV